MANTQKNILILSLLVSLCTAIFTGYGIFYPHVGIEERMRIALEKKVGHSIFTVSACLRAYLASGREIAWNGEKIKEFSLGCKSGAGGVVSREGHLITNFHVVDLEKEKQNFLLYSPLRHFIPGEVEFRAEYAVRSCATKEKFKANLVETSIKKHVDLAILHAPKVFVRPLIISTDVPMVGESIAVVGSPLGYECMWQYGAVPRTELDAPADDARYLLLGTHLNPGNSGGILFRLSTGEVIGIPVKIILTRNNQNSGLSEALPAVPTLVEYLKKVLPQRKHVRTTR